MKPANLAAFFAGLIFSVGLSIAEMTRPTKIFDFLDVWSEYWDPSLLFVMIGAISVHMVSYRLIRRRRRPLLESDFHIPPAGVLSGSLLWGSAIFGIGWGLGGFCPGPALVASAALKPRAIVFVVAMLTGILLAQLWERRRRLRRSDGE